MVELQTRGLFSVDVPVQAKGTSLAARFSGRWEQCLDRDSQGRIFLDFDPYCFEKLLSYLRARQVDEISARNTPEPIIAPDKRHEFRGFIKYMGLEEYMGCAQQPCFVTFDPDVSCNYDGQVIRSGVGTQGKTAVVDVPMSAGEVHYFKIHIQKLGNPVAKLFVGVGKKVDMSAGATMPNTSICGWASPALVITQGVSSAVNNLVPRQTEDFVCLKVDLQIWCVALTSSRGTSPVRIMLSSDDKDPLILLVTLYGHGQQVQLVPIESMDQSLLDIPPPIVS